MERLVGPIVVIADTHVGLSAGERFYMLRNNSGCDVLGLSGFIRWLERLETERVAVPRGRWGGPLELQRPSHLILLGDYLELWDASDAAVDISCRSIWNMMERLTCEKIYVIGNHDFASNQLTGRYPQGASFIQVLPDSYPSREAGKAAWLRTDDTSFLFVHGHQFDWAFRHLGKVWTLVSYLRDGAEAFRLWSWVLVLVAFGALLVGFLPSPFSSVLATLAAALLLAGALPRLIVAVARPAWNHLAGTRYEPSKALTGFVHWWKHWIGEKPLPDGRLCIVYGHTHLMDIYNAAEIRKHTGRTLPEQLTLVNLPSWVSDVRDEYQKIFRDVALYIDDSGFHLLGWDWRKQQPFYIPEDAARTVAAGIPLDEQLAEGLATIGWPEKLLAKLKQPPVILAQRRPVRVSA